MSDRVQVQKNSSAPSQMVSSSQFQERPFTDERYQPVATAGTITADSPPQPNIARASFNLLNMPIFAPSSGANMQEGNIQRQEEEKQEKEPENSSELQTKPELIVQAKCSQCEAEEKEKEQNGESVQTKLTVGKPGDQYEQEADSMAAKVMAMPDSAVGQSIQGQTDDEKREIQTSPLVNSITPVVQRSPNSTTPSSASIESSLANSKGGGSPLPDEVRSFMEPRFGADFSSVKVHTDSAAVQMNKDLGAQAFAHGSDIYYGAGKSPGKDELTAHELTHTVQQGGAVKAKLETPTEKRSETDSSKTDSSNNGQTQTAVTSGDTNKKAETEHSPENQEKQTENLQNGEQAKENADKSGKSESAQGVEIVPQQGKPLTENGSEAKGEGETSPAADAVEAAKPQEEIQLPKEAKAPGEGEKRKDQESANQDGKGESKALKEVPEAQALKEATANNEKVNQNLEGNKEAANPETEAEKEKSTAEAGEATTKLDATNAEAAQLASAGINFASPEQEETGEGGEGAVVALKPKPSGNSALLEQQRAQASAQASGFLAQAAGRVQTITGLGQSIPGRIQAAAANAKAGVMAAVEQQKAVVTAQIAQLRAQAQSEAQAAIAQIQAQHQAAAAAIPQTTATARQQIDSEHTTALQTLDDRVNNQISHIEEVYSQAGDKYRDAGVRIGDEALARCEERAKEYESKITGRDDNLWDGPLTDNRNRARANAAREVGKQYKQGLIDEANKQADQVQEGKSKDIETINQIADKSRETLQTHHQASLDSLNAAEQQALSQAQEAQTSLTEAANNSLQATLQSLDQQQASQLQLLAGYGESQVSAIDRDAQKAIASLQDGVNQAAASLQNALKDCQAQLQGAPAPNPEELSAALAEIMGQFDSSVAKVQQQTEQGVAASEQGIAQGGQQVIGGVSTLAQTGLQESAAVVEGARTTLTNLNQGATDSFNQIQEAYTTMVTSTTESSIKGFGEVTQGIEKTFEQVNQNLESGIEKSVGDLEQGLRGSFEQMEADIHKYAEEAAAKEEPRGVQFFKTLAKVFLVVAVIVVAIVAAPAAIAAVGAVAGALGAGAALASGIGMVVGGAIVGAAAGAVIQMGNNLIDGKPIFEDIGKAALAGAIGGALGGAGGALGNVLGAAGKLGAGISQSIAKFGIDVAFDIAGGIAGNLATGDPITLEGVLIGAGIGAAVQISTANLGKLGKFGQKIQGMQTRSFQAGEQFGTSLGNKIKSGFSGGVDAPTVSRPDVNMPGVRSVDTEVKSPQTEVKAPETEVKAPETSVKPPETEVKVPETQVKPPETDTPNGRTSHADEPEVESGKLPKQNNEEAVRIIRQDNDFAALVNHKGKPKSHVAEDGSLVPANPKGSATPLEHVYGSDPAKGDSPYTSFLTEKGGVAKPYGNSEVELDLPRLQADIQSGHLKDVEILTPEQISGAIKSEIDQIATVDINAAIAKGPQGIPDYVASLKISKSKASKLERRLLAYYNTTRDGEYLVKGTIPPTYLRGPYSVKAPDTNVKAPGTQVKTPESELPSGTRSGADQPSNTRSDADANTPHGLKSDSDLPMTTKEQEILKNTAPKRGDELTSEELNTELELAGKAEGKSIDEGEYVEEIKLPNDHEWKQKEDGTWCRFSNDPTCMKKVEPASQLSERDKRAKRRRDQQESSTEPTELQKQLKKFVSEEPITLHRYLEGVKKSAEDLKRWSSEYDKIFEQAKTKFPENESKNIDGWNEGITSQIISANGKIFNDLQKIINYSLGQNSKAPVVSGGLADLRVVGEEITGRPNFSEETQKYLELQPATARRHIVAWHTLKSFMNTGYQALGQKLITPLRNNLNQVAPNHMVEKANELIEKLPENSFGNLNKEDAKVLMTALYVMNSNPNNLWVGSASENSNINTASRTINDQISQLTDMQKAVELAKNWKEETNKSKEVNTSKKVAADVIIAKQESIQKKSQKIEELENTNPQEQGQLQKLKEEVEEENKNALAQIKNEIQNIRGTLEIDVITINKDTTKEIFEKRSQIVEAAKTLYKIQEGLTDIKNIKPENLDGIIKTMMQYPDDYVGEPTAKRRKIIK